MFGYHGRYLRADPDGSACVPIEAADLRKFLGGVGLGTLILAREVPARANPLGPEAALVFALGPLVGSALTTSAKFAVLGLSPLTGRLSDALSSSHFALAARRAGVDAIAVRGRCEVPSVLFVDGLGLDVPTVSYEPAGDLWGLSAGAAEASIRDRCGPGWQVAAIGPAGERLVPFANISHDGRHAGRGGLGAVLGSKNLKAIAVRGDRRLAMADPSSASRIARDLAARSMGPATEKYRVLGTVANLLAFDRLEMLPTRNFSDGRFEGVGRLASENLGPSPQVERKSCAACTIGCEHRYESAGKPVRMEYESLFALGPLCGVDDPSAVLRAASACDDLGLDTISTGGTIAFLMACAARGWIDGVLPSGRPLRFGDGEAVVEAVGAIVGGEGIGALLAMGSRRAAEKIGGDAPTIAMHVKGLELPGYDPRGAQSLALGLAVGTRGADHNRSGAYDADFSGRVDRKRGGPDSVVAAIESEDRSALIDSLILCKFLRGALVDLHGESAAMLRAVVGWEIDGEELRAIAARVVSARKLLNQREGWTAAEDTLPASLLGDMPATPGGPTLPRERLEAMIRAYYRGRGWSEDGTIGQEERSRLGLDGDEFG